MQYFKNFEHWQGSEKLKNVDNKTGIFEEPPLSLEEYEKAIVNGLIIEMEKRLSQPLNKIVTGDDKFFYVWDLVDCRKNDSYEDEPDFPETFDVIMPDLWEQNVSVYDAIQQFIDGCLELYNGHGSVM